MHDMVDFCKLISTREEEDGVNQQLDKVNQLHWDKVDMRKNYNASIKTHTLFKTTRKVQKSSQFTLEIKFDLSILRTVSIPVTCVNKIKTVMSFAVEHI